MSIYIPGMKMPTECWECPCAYETEGAHHNYCQAVGYDTQLPDEGRPEKGGHMNMKPILFNTEMVRAILDGRKTQTRRVNKDGGEYSMPDMSLFDARRRTYGVHHYQSSGYAFRDKISLVEAPVPICPGDILWVRETWRVVDNWFGRVRGYEITYKAGGDNLIVDGFGPEPSKTWRPSIHMPKEAARLFLRVTDVRVERLQGINTEDIKAEGITVPQGFPPVTPYSRFADLWDSTIKLTDLDLYGWNANPWVWVISFARYYPADPEGGAAG